MFVWTQITHPKFICNQYSDYEPLLVNLQAILEEKDSENITEKKLPEPENQTNEAKRSEVKPEGQKELAPKKAGKELKPLEVF
jgi:recombinational DNA repair protein RecT